MTLSPDTALEASFSVFSTAHSQLPRLGRVAHTLAEGVSINVALVYASGRIYSFLVTESCLASREARGASAITCW